nr:hypothetical protein [uncultured Acetobacterium sp.]
MNEQEILKKVNDVVATELKDLPFSQALPKIQELIWKLADENGVDGSEIFKKYMDSLS